MKQRETQRPGDWLLRHWEPLLFMLVMLAALLLRAWRFGAVPGGLNQDEASIGYDAWSILHHGVDRNGIRLPVHLIAWGSGQNALYAYLSMPFIAAFGLNVASVRMVNLLFGLLSVALCQLILRRTVSVRAGFIGMILMAVAPWNVMLSRWGLESNLLPGLFLLAFYVLLAGLDRHGLLPLAAALFALSLYAYGAAYLVVPVFCAAAGVYMVCKARVPLRFVLLSAGVFVLVAVPIGLFILTNLFHWGDIRIFGFTAPEMTGVARLTAITGSDAPGSSALSFFNNVILQRDNTTSNFVDGYGTMYLISLPFTLLGAAALWKYRNRQGGRLTVLLFAWLAGSLLLFLVYAATNINRVNIIYPVLILLTALGIDYLCAGWKRLAVVGCCYALLLTGFCTAYFGRYAAAVSKDFFASLGEAIEKADSEAGENETIYITNSINAPYIYALFYTQTPPDEYLETVRIADLHVQFQQVTSFGRFVFNTSGLTGGQPGVYILPRSQRETAAARGAILADYENYLVVRVS